MDNRKQKRQKKNKTDTKNSNLLNTNSVSSTNSIDSSKPTQDIIMELQTVQASIKKICLKVFAKFSSILILCSHRIQYIVHRSMGTNVRVFILS